MNLIIWNARGLGNPRAFRELGRLVTDKCPTLLFLSETKMREFNCRSWKFRLGFSGSFMWIEDATVWRFTGFYGHPESACRHFSWDLLYKLKTISELRDIPWLVRGDFNEICYDSEKLGGNRKAPSQLKAFKDTLEVCELPDICCRAMAISLEFYHSDHRPIWLKLCGDQKNHRMSLGSFNSLFRFERCWLMEVDCHEVVRFGWRSNESSLSLMERITSCKVELSKCSLWPSNGEQVNILEREVENLASKEELYWHQRSRASWLKDGDRNTRFFHAKASMKKSQNTLQGLVSNHGDSCSDNQGMASIVLDYYGSLFSLANPTAADMSRILEIIVPSVHPHMNRYLCLPFTATEVRQALFDMHPDKAPGPDGTEVTNAVLGILNDGNSLEGWNETLVTLIPKIKDPVILKDYRPISLCNVCYKIVARTLTNRLIEEN
ncbi:uncharacterized protein [Henckelia pumila]|uniref:uncharacterized protein n=1 Tax=Henckelia pumila TaxID=405737 RepID=UPI003C6E7F4C